MKDISIRKKRPCRICRRWFMPDPRLKGRQKTCAKAECKREWHRRQCAQWNKKHTEYFRANYLRSKLEAATQHEQGCKIGQPGSGAKAMPRGRFHSGLPLEEVQEVIGVQQLIIIEYLAQLLMQRFQEVIR